MAKLKGPLFSLGASGAIGKTLVFFPWKGLDCVREYVIPANPDTQAQKDQRNLLKNAVIDIHAAMAIAIGPLVEVDKSAYALWGSTYPTPRTWFNQACKNWIDISLDTKDPAVYRGGVSAPGSSLLHPSIKCDEIDGTKITAGKFFYGTSKTAMLNSAVATITAGIHQASKEISGLTAGKKYYWQFRPDAGEDCIGANSGIYHGTPTA